MNLDNKKNGKNNTEQEIKGYDPDADFYDPKAEYEAEKELKKEMEPNDMLALIIAGFKVFGPFILIAIILIILLML